MYIRILSVRKHKNIAFINAYTSKDDNTQFMIDNNLLKGIKCGDLISINYIDTVNDKGKNIKKIIEINEKISCTSFESFKGINGRLLDVKEKNFLDARNGGKQLQILKYKREIISRIRSLLDSLNYFDATGLTNTVEHYQNGSGIIEAEISKRSANMPRYLRISLENQLKQMISISLNSTYAIDKVFRNMGEDSSHINEFLMLELVSISNDLDNLTNFVKNIDILSKEVAEEYKIDIKDKDLEVIDYKEIKESSIDYENLRKDFANTLVLNYEVNSPFIKKDEITSLRKEARWYMNGHFIGHYYKDENDFSNIREVLENQKALSLKDNINPLDYFNWGVPSTASLGLSIDRWLMMLLGSNNITSIANPISLDYQKKRRK